MKYRLLLFREYDQSITIVFSGTGFSIYMEAFKNTIEWSEGFRFSPDHVYSNKYTQMNKHYHEHREEYITEAKKLLVKEML